MFILFLISILFIILFLIISFFLSELDKNGKNYLLLMAFLLKASSFIKALLSEQI